MEELSNFIIMILFNFFAKSFYHKCGQNTRHQTQLTDGITAKYKHHDVVKPSLTLRNSNENFVRFCLFWRVARALTNSPNFSRFISGDTYKWQNSLLCDFLQPHVTQIHIFYSTTIYLSSSFHIRTISPSNRVRGETTSEISGFHRSPYRWEGYVAPKRR